MPNLRPSRAPAVFALCLIVLSTLSSAAWAAPTRPICIDAGNHQYFRYDGRVIALVGTSAEYLPHVSWATQKDNYATLETYGAFIDDVVGRGLNRMRVWVSLADAHNPPLAHETPFCLNPIGTATNYSCDNNLTTQRVWDLTRWDKDIHDKDFFTNLKAVIAYAGQGGATGDTTKAVIVEVTLFDSFQGQFDGPWNTAYNSQTYGFTDRKYLTAFDGATGDLILQNQQARARQVALVKKLADELKTYHNFYWELSNEPDIASANGPTANMIAWSNYIANELYVYEGQILAGKHHLIGVNYHATDTLASAGANSQISVVSGHYVDLTDSMSPGRLSAIEMIRAYDGGPSGSLDRVFGFNEGRITPSTLGAFYVTPEATRAEAWEFMIDGGGSFDHLGYKWNDTGQPEPQRVRDTLGRLATFLDGLDLGHSHRSPLNAQAKPVWAPGVPAYGSARGDRSIFWAALEGPGDYVLYLHHSGKSTHTYKAYTPCQPPGCNRSPLTSLQVQMPNTGKTYTAQWIDPSTMGQVGSTTSFTGNGQTKTLTVPAYPDFDLLLHITYAGITNITPCQCAGDPCY